MSVINYTIKPFHPASDSSSGQPISVTRNESGETITHRGQLSSPDVPLTPEPVSAQKRLDLAKGAAWCRILRATREKDEAGVMLIDRIGNLRDVATMVGTSAPTLSRLLKKFGSLRDDQLTPERLAPTLSGGKECEWEFLTVQAHVRAKLLALYVATMGASSANAANDRRTAKAATAIRQFAWEPECPEPLRARLREGYQPVPFLRFLRGNVTPEVEARLRGPKHFQNYGPSCRRDDTCRLPNGDRFERPAAWSLSADDMSANEPFYVTLPDGDILSRQGLYFIWAKHKVWQSADLIARARESYRAEDILRAFYKTCLAAGGVPSYVQFEQGVWHSHKVTGFHLDNGWLLEEEFERPAMDKGHMDTIVQGLGLCGVKVNYQYKPHTKEIETHFNYLQTILAITARNYQCIGRYAGEFEHGAKQLRRVRAGSFSARDLHFASQHELADCIVEAFNRINSELTPDGRTRYDAHWQDLQQVPLLPLTEQLFAACLPGEPRKTTLRGGYINVQSRGKEYQYRHEKFAALGDGYELFYKIDETDPNLGAAIFNRSAQSNSANFQRWKPGDFMFTAAREIPGPKLEVTTAPAGVRVETIEERYGAGAVDSGDMVRRKQDKYVATQFRAMPRPGQIAVRSASARDGQGNVVEVTNVDAQHDGSCTRDHRLSESAASREIVGSTPTASDPSSALPPRAVAARPAKLPYELRKLFNEQQPEAAPK